MTFAQEPIDIATWPAIYGVLAPAMARCGETPAELIDALLAKTDQLWVMRKGGDPVAVAVSELYRDHRGLIAHGRLLAGDGMDAWVDDLITTITEFARANHANAIEIEGRTGWERVLKTKGWRRAKVIMELSLEGAGE